jgi:NAD(P)H-dependent nitrite reductase small subunit
MTAETSLSPVALEPTWFPVCTLEDLPRERGACALVDGNQVALFRTFDDIVYAVQQLDPYSGAHVMSRGIVGTRGGAPTVASPMYKQVFDLRSGQCLDPVGKDPRHLLAYAVQVADGVVSIGPASAPDQPLRPDPSDRRGTE